MLFRCQRGWGEGLVDLCIVIEIVVTHFKFSNNFVERAVVQNIKDWNKYRALRYTELEGVGIGKDTIDAN